jgi:hypothetical protein
LHQDNRVVREGTVEDIPSRIRTGGIVPPIAEDELSGSDISELTGNEIDNLPGIETSEVWHQPVVPKNKGMKVVIVESGDNRIPIEIDPTGRFGAGDRSGEGLFIGTDPLDFLTLEQECLRPGLRGVHRHYSTIVKQIRFGAHGYNVVIRGIPGNRRLERRDTY